MLQFATCPTCHESHALRGDGRMSIHDTTQGVRCDGPAAELSDPARATGRRRNDPDPDNAELQAAFEVAADRRRGRYIGRESSVPFDRRIYATGRARIVPGGDPGHGKRA